MSDTPVTTPAEATPASPVTTETTPVVAAAEPAAATPAAAPAETKPAEATAATTPAAAEATPTAATEPATTTEATPTATPATETKCEETTTETKAEETKTEEKTEDKKSKKKEKVEKPKKVVPLMFGVAQKGYGAPREVLSLSKELIKPEIRSSKQVLIRVHAAGINPVDYKFLHGNLAAVVKRKFPYTPGLDFSGVVEAVGKSVKRVKVGDAVYGDLGAAGGAYADYVVAEEQNIALKPTNLTFAEAASVPVAALTSYQALLKHGGLKTGQKVLILGGAGGTGSYGIQLAKHFGAHVTATSSARNQAFCQSLGADRVFDYSSGEWWSALPQRSFNVIYDTVGEPKAWEHAKQVLAKGGIFVTIAGDNPGGKTSVGGFLGDVITVAGRKFASIVTRHRYHWFLTDASGNDLTALAKLFEEGKIRSIIEKYYSIENKEAADEKEGVVEFFEHAESGRTRGKIALEIHEAGERHVFNFDTLPAYVPPAEPEVKEEVKTPVITPGTETSTPAETPTAAPTTVTTVTTEKPAEAATSTEKPAEKPAETPAEKPAEKVAEPAAAAQGEASPVAVEAQ